MAKSIILRLSRLRVYYIQAVLLLCAAIANYILCIFQCGARRAKAAWQERRASCRVLNSRVRFECQRNCGVSRWPWETEDYMRTLSLKVTKQTIISLPKILHQPPIYYIPRINRCLTNVGVNEKQKTWAVTLPPRVCLSAQEASGANRSAIF